MSEPANDSPDIAEQRLAALREAADYALHKIVGALDKLTGEAPASAAAKLRDAERRLYQALNQKE